MLATPFGLDMRIMRLAYRYVNGYIDICRVYSYRRNMDNPKDPRVITPMPQSLLTAIDDFRFANRLASRSEAIRQLITVGLAVANTAPQSPKPRKASADAS